MVGLYQKFEEKKLEDAVDRCRVWESHSNTKYRCYVAPTWTGTRLVCPKLWATVVGMCSILLMALSR